MDKWVDGALVRLVQRPANTKVKHLQTSVALQARVGASDYHHMRSCACTQHASKHTSKHACTHAPMHKHTQGGWTDEWMDDALAKVPHARIHTHERAQHGRTGGIRPMVRIQRRSGMKRYMMRENCSTTGSSMIARAVGNLQQRSPTAFDVFMFKSARRVIGDHALTTFQQPTFGVQSFVNLRQSARKHACTKNSRSRRRNHKCCSDRRCCPDQHYYGRG
jgi:hypothetical protein